jgi:uncharacterized membrane protein YbhN (UPF0104 family)/tRNA A-37 threonylcarbamoyl transferase component Bud32
MTEGPFPPAAPMAAGTSPSEAEDAHRTVTVRHPADVTRLLAYLSIAALGLLTAIGAEQATAGIEGDLLQLVSRLPGVVLSSFLLAIEVLHLLLFLGIPAVLLVARRWRRLGIYTLGYVLTAILVTVASSLVTPERLEELPDFGIDPDVVVGWPPSSAVATSVTAVVLLTPHINRAWRSFGWAFIASLALLRIVTAREVALDLVLAIGIGGAVGAALLLAFGRRVMLPAGSDVTAALQRIGLAATTSAPIGENVLGRLPFRTRLADGGVLHCTALTAEQYQADSLRRRYRRARTRELGEEVAFSSARRAAAVEAMLALTAARAGARTPTVHGVAPMSGDDMVIAAQEVPGRPLSEVEPDRINDDVLRQMWSSLAAMQSAGVAHRALQLSNWLLDDAQQVWLIDFSYGEPAATDGALASDIAEVLAATYGVVGPDRTVAAAIHALGAERLATGISYLVPAALTKETRADLKGTEGLQELVDAVAEACGVAEPEFVEVERVKPRTLVIAAMLVVAIYVLLPQLADLPRMLEAIRGADPLLALGAVLASLATYLGTALALSGSIPAPVRYIHSLLAAVASSFASAVAPPGVAHVGLNVRFAQRQGLPGPAAVSAAASKEVAIVVVHVVLLLLVAILAGSSGVLAEELEKLPDWRTLGIGVALLIAVIGVAAALPGVRKVVGTSVLPAVRHSLASLQQLVADPIRMLVMFSGALLLQVGYISALYFSVHALGGDISLVTIALLYLTVGSAATVAPTPGGVGAVEAVLLAALTGVGMAAAPALAAVFLYRLVTFWIPIPIGGLAMRHLVARKLL